MFALKTVLVALIPVAAATAIPRDAHSASLTSRASCVYECGSVCYWQSDIDAALKSGVSHHNAGTTLGSDKYPHQYNDYEGFKFPSSGPWYEYPILNSFKVYNGGSPGADRVVFDSNGKFDSLVTHTGASGDDFLACKVG